MAQRKRGRGRGDKDARVGVGGGAGEALDGRDVDGDDEVRLGVEVAARAEAGRVEGSCVGAHVTRQHPFSFLGGREEGGHAPSPPVMEVAARAAEAAERVARAATAKRILLRMNKGEDEKKVRKRVVCE